MVEYVSLEKEKMPKLYHFGKYSISPIEIKHLSFALIMTILTIFVFQNKSAIFDLAQVFSLNFVITFFIYFFTIGLGFVLHEFGHKLVAQHYGFISEFRADFTMLIFMFVFALISPFIFLAPGAVMILGRPTIKQNGIISVAGPVVNLVLALIFILLAFILSPQNNTLSTIIYLGIFINAFLGIFNMLPFWVLDGKKVLKWNWPIYTIVMASLVIILIANIKGLFI